MERCDCSNMSESEVGDFGPSSTRAEVALAEEAVLEDLASLTMSDVKGVPVHQLHQDAQDAEVPENVE